MCFILAKQKKNLLCCCFCQTGAVCALISSLFSSCPIFVVTLFFFFLCPLKKAPIEFKRYNPQKATV